MKILANNKKAFFDYEIVEKFEAGISLLGPEVKSISAGKVSLKESFISVSDGNVIWKQGHVTIADHVTFDRPSETRERRLLLHKKEIKTLIGKVSRDGMTVVPLSIYKNDRGLIKMEIALAKGKKDHDKRESIKKKEADREMQRAMKNN